MSITEDANQIQLHNVYASLKKNVYTKCMFFLSTIVFPYIRGYSSPALSVCYLYEDALNNSVGQAHISIDKLQVAVDAHILYVYL